MNLNLPSMPLPHPSPIRMFSGFVLALFVMVGSSQIGQAQAFSSELPNFWSNPQFLKKFMGDYGIRSDIEPKISSPDQAVLQQVIPQIQSNLAGAASTLQRSIRPDSSAALDFTLGSLLLQLQRPSDAEAEFLKAIQKFPDFMRAHKNLGIARVQGRRFDLAIQSLVKAAELGAHDANLYGLLGYCYLKLEDHHAASTAYLQAISLDRENLDWKLGLAQSLLAQERYVESISVFDQLIVLRPNQPDYWLFQANAYLAIGAPMKAAANYEIVRAMGSASQSTFMNLGDIYLNEKLLDLASEVYSQALQQTSSQDYSRWLRVSQAFLDRGRWQDAENLLKRLGDPGSLSAINRSQRLKMLARIDLAADRMEAAAIKLEQYLEGNPLDAEALLLLARYQAETGQNEKAELSFDRASKMQGFEVTARIQYAQFLVTQHQYADAIPLLKEALRREPSPPVQKYLDQLTKIVNQSNR